MKCKGITKKGNFCGTSCKYLYCQYHRLQYWGIVVVFGVLLGIYSNIKNNIFPKEDVGLEMLARYEKLLQEKFELEALCSQLEASHSQDCVLTVDGISYDSNKLSEIAKRIEKNSRSFLSLGNEEFSNDNYTKAKEWFEKSAENGNTYAIYNLGVMYILGKGVEKDRNKAKEFYKRSANNGNKYAMFNIGLMYREGEAKNMDETEKWFLKAAQNDLVIAMRMLGEMYRGGPKMDLTKSFNWFLIAAKKGDTNSMNHVGSMYSHGTGVTKDRLKAQNWYYMAAQKGDEHGIKNYNSISKSLERENQRSQTRSQRMEQ